MSRLGLCTNANGLYPSPAGLAALGVGRGDFLRTPVQGPLSLVEDMLGDLPADVSLMVSLNSECAEVRSDWSGWVNACGLLAAMSRRWPGRILIVGCGNELDLWHLQPPEGQPDPRLTPEFAADLVRSASPILRGAGIRVAMSSVASGSWPAYLSAMAQACNGAADYADLHLYMKRCNGVPNDPNWQDASNAIIDAQVLSGLPVICSEAGIKVNNAGGLNQQAQWAAGLADLPSELVCYFAWSDGVGTAAEQGGNAFGAVDASGKRKPVWYTLQKLFGGPMPISPAPDQPDQPAEFVLGFEKWHNLEPDLIGRPLRNERNIAPEWQTQPTSNGVLSWVGGKGHAFVQHDGRVFRWAEDSPASWEVPG